MSQPYINPEKQDLRVGIVLSDKRDKTRTVRVAYGQKHRKYGKYLTLNSKFQAHDEHNESQVGDRVEIASCRPISKTKSWIVTRVLEKAPGQFKPVEADPDVLGQTTDETPADEAEQTADAGEDEPTQA